MSSLGVFEIIAGTASILALLIVLGSLTLKQWRIIQQKREQAEQTLEQEFIRLKMVGTTVSARTDLGFFALLELGSLRDSITYYRHFIILMLLYAVILLLLGHFIVIHWSVSFITPSMVIKGSMIFFILLFIFVIVTQISLIRFERYINLYQSRIQEVWQRSIDKRTVDKND